MSAEPLVLYWRRVDVEGFERAELRIGTDRIDVTATVLCAGMGGFRLDHRWTLSPSWTALRIEVERWNRDGLRKLLLERDGDGWAVDGTRRPDLDGAEEPDLSVTPLCNTFPIRRLPLADDSVLTLDTAYIDGAAMTVERSCQRYVRRGARSVRYVDLGAAKGFEADLLVDELGLVLVYQHLFERIPES